MFSILRLLPFGCLDYVAYLCCAKSNNLYYDVFETNFFWFCLLAGAGIFTVLSAGVFFLASRAHRVSRVEDTCVRWRSVSWSFLRFRWNAAFRVRKILVTCRRVCYVRCWVFAQPGNETRTTDSSLKCFAAALHLRPMMSIFGAMRRLLSERRNGWVLLNWVSVS